MGGSLKSTESEIFQPVLGPSWLSFLSNASSPSPHPFWGSSNLPNFLLVPSLCQHFPKAPSLLAPQISCLLGSRFDSHVPPAQSPIEPFFSGSWSLWDSASSSAQASASVRGALGMVFDSEGLSWPRQFPVDWKDPPSFQLLSLLPVSQIQGGRKIPGAGSPPTLHVQ